MFEAQVAYYLNKYLGKYVYGLDPEKLKISVWRGDVQLSNLQLKPEALQDLNLPISVKAGLLGKLTLKVPWTKLGREPVIVEFDRLYILAAPRTDEETEVYQDPDEFERVAAQRALQAKRQRLQNAEMDWIKELEARAAHEKALDGDDGKGGGNMFGNLIQTILGNLQLRVTNVHIRYEDHLSNPGHKFSVGVMFKEISAHTVDQQGNKAFITVNVLQSLRKAVTLQQLALYFDVDQPLFEPAEKWTTMDIPAWDALFLPPDTNAAPAVVEGEEDVEVIGPQPKTYQYLLCPVDGSMIYIRRDRSTCKTPEDARQEMDLKLVNITIAFSRAHYLNTQKLLTGFEDYQARADNIHFRPKCRPANALTSKLWWRYAFHGVKKRLHSAQVRWNVVGQACTMRRKYIPLYVKMLQQNKLGGDESIAEMDAVLPEATIMLFRKMAHAKVELAKKQEAVRATQKQLQQQPQQHQGGGGWLGWWMGGGGRPPPDKDKGKEKDGTDKEAGQEVKEEKEKEKPGKEPDGAGGMKSGLDAEEWKKLEELLGSQTVEDRSKDTPHTLRMRLRVQVQSAALMLRDADGVEAVAGSLQTVSGCLDSFPTTKRLQLAVKMANIRCPEGTLLSTGVIEDKDARGQAEAQAMSLEYTHKPQDGIADGVAKLLVAPSYVTYNAVALQRIVQLFSSQEAVQLARLQAQAAVRAEQIRRMAELRLKALSTEERKPKLLLSLTFHAPKVAIPCKGVTLLMDLGLFTLDTYNELATTLPPEEAALYECFKLGIKNISAYLVNGEFNWPAETALTADMDLPALLHDHLSGTSRTPQPVLERFAMNAVVQAATTMHPRYPAIKADVKANPLRIQISPSRFQHIMMVVRSLLPEKGEEAAGQLQDHDQPLWMVEAEYSAPVQLLSWEGLTTAKWSNRKLYLFRGRVYVTKHKDDAAELVGSRSFWQTDRVVMVPPEHVGSVSHVIALCPPGVKRSEVAEREDAMVLRCSSKNEVSELRIKMMQSKSQMQVLAGLLPTDDVESTQDPLMAKADVFDEVMKHKTIVELQGEIEEIALVLSGREPVRWWPTLLEGKDPPESLPQPEPYPAGRLAVLEAEEVPLMEMKLSVARVKFHYSPDKLHAELAMRAMDVDDLLVGKFCDGKGKMAHSIWHSRVLSHQISIQDPALVAADHADPASDADPGSPEVVRRGSSVSSLMGEVEQLVQLTFTQYSASSEFYEGLDTEITLKLATLCFFLNRPTVAALMGLGKDMAEVMNALQPVPANPPPSVPEADDRTLVSAPSAILDPSIQRRGGAERTIFRMTVSMSKLRLQAEYEGDDTDPMCLLEVDNFEYSLNVHPSTIHIVTSLGNVVGQYTQLAETNPYRTICDMRSKKESSLIKVDYQLHSKEESYNNTRVPDGLPFHSVQVQTSAVQLVFLRRFLNEMLEYLSVMLSMCAPPRVKELPLPDGSTAPALPVSTPGASMAETVAGKLGSKADQAIPLVVLLDVSLEAPIITLPFSSVGASYVDVDLGTLEVHNEVVWEAGETTPSDKKIAPQVLMDRMDILLSGVGIVVAQSATQRGNNLIQEMGQGLQVYLRRPCAADNGILPPLQTSTVVPTLKASLLDSEYRTILSILSSNFSEAVDLPPQVALVHRHVLYQPPTPEQPTSVPSTPGSKTIPAFGTAFSPRSHALALSPTSPKRQAQKVAESSPLNDCSADLSAVMAALKDRSSIKATVSIAQAELELLNENNDSGKPTPLACATFSNFWLVYQGSQKGNMFVSISLPTAKARDMRPGVPREHSVVLSTHSLSARIPTADTMHGSRSEPSLEKIDSVGRNAPTANAALGASGMAPSLLTLEYRSIRSEPTPLQVVRMRLQRPTLVADIGFMMAVLGFVTSSSANQSSGAPPPFITGDVHLDSTPHQAEADLWLSPEFRLLADTPATKSFEYNGQGHCIILPAGITASDALPLIVVGNNATLRFRNVRIVNSASLPACLSMAPGAQLVMDRSDGVELLDSDTSIRTVYGLALQGLAAATKHRFSQHHHHGDVKSEQQGLEGVESAPSQFVVELHTLGMALHLVDTTQLVQKQQQAELQARQRKDGIMARGGGSRAQLSNLAETGLPSNMKDYVLRMLAVYVDLSAKYSSFSGQQSAEAELHNLSIATQTNLLQYDPSQRTTGSQVHGDEDDDQVMFGKGVVSVRSSVLEPCDIYAKFELLPSKQELKVKTSDITLKMSPDVLQLVTHLQSRLLAPIIHAPTDQPLARCDRFERLWTSHSQIHDGPPYPRAGAGGVDVMGADRGITLWRPQPPTGYVMLGDVVTAGSEQPSSQVAAVAINSGLAAYPVAYDLVWASPEGVTVWRPVPPPDYVSMGCVVSLNEQQPRLKLVGCVHKHAVVDSFLGECMMLSSNGNLWCLQNAAGTFEVSPAESHLPQVQMYDLRSPVGVPPANQSTLEHLAAEAAQFSGLSKKDVPLSLVAQHQYHRQRRQMQEKMAQQRLQAQAVEFARIWWDKDIRKPSPTKMSLWRPVPPPGYAALGDCMVVGLHAPPQQVVVLKMDDAYDVKTKGAMPVLKKPVKYRLVWVDENKARTGRMALMVWRPIAPEGYVSMGMVATEGEDPNSIGLPVCCVRQDFVSSLKMTHPHWHLDPYKERTEIHAWKVDDSTGCFLLERANVKEVVGYQLRTLDEDETMQPGSPSASSGMNVNVEIGRTSLLLRNTLKVPILELEAHKCSTTIVMEGPNVVRCVIFTETSLHSYNGPLQAWEPVIEPWEMLLHMDMVFGAKPVKGMVPGMTMKVNSTQGTVHVTFAHAAINSLLDGMAEWQQLEHLEDARTFRRQLAAAEGSSIEAVVLNTTGDPAQMKLHFGTHQTIVDLPPGEPVETQQPLPPIAPGRSLLISHSPPPIRMFVDVLNGSLLDSIVGPGVGRQLYAIVRVQMDVSDDVSALQQNTGWGLITRAVVPTPDKTVEWNERFLVSLPLAMVEQLLSPAPGDNQFTDAPLKLELAVYDGAGDSGLGKCIGTGELSLEYKWLESQVNAIREVQQTGVMSNLTKQLSRSIALDVDNQATSTFRANLVVMVDPTSVDTTWQSQTIQGQQRSNIGQRAIKLVGTDKWVPLNATASYQQHSTSVVAINLGDGLALYTSYEGGRRSGVLRSLCQLTNSTNMVLEVAITHDPDDAYQKLPVTVSDRSANVGDVVEEEVFENERFVPFKNWSYKNLLITERGRYSRGRDARVSSNDFPNVPLPPGWEWEGPWMVEKSGSVDENGWAYAWDWKACTYPIQSGAGLRKPTDFVRRRRLVRRRRKVSQSGQGGQAPAANMRTLGVVAPGNTLALPNGWKKETHQLLVRPVRVTELGIDAVDPDSHQWSLGASEGQHGVKLGSLEEGAARLVCCKSSSGDPSVPYVTGPPTDDEASRYAHSLPTDCWFSLLTDCDPLTDYTGTTLKDWNIVAHPPLLIRNLLPVPANYIVWERTKENTKMRQKGKIDAGAGEHIYTTDMRTQVLLTFFPEGTSPVSEPIIISEGFYKNDSGISGRQMLDTEFQCQYQNSASTHNLRILVERDISSSAIGRIKRSELDPGAAVALGFPLTVRLYVPLWIENATQLPICAGLITNEPSSTSIVSFGGDSSTKESLAQSLRVLDTDSQASKQATKPYTYIQIPPNSVELLSYNYVNDGGRQYGLTFSIMGSMWTEPYLLQSAPAAAGGGEGGSGAAPQLGSSVPKFEPVLIRAHKDNCVYEVSLRLVAAGVLWRRSQVIRLETHVIVSNRTGFRLLLTPPQLKASSRTSPTGQALPSRVELPAGAVGVPLHQNITQKNQRLDSRTFVVRLAAGGGQAQDPMAQLWSEEFTVQYPGSGNMQVLVPVYVIPRTRTPQGPRGLREAEMREAAKQAFRALYQHSDSGPDTAREVDVALTKAARPGDDGNIDYYALVMNIVVQPRSPGCLHIVLSSVGGEPRNVLMNCTPTTIKYRQSVSLAVWQTLLPFSTQGFACPYQVNGCNEVELRDASPYASATHPPQVFRLDPGTQQSAATASSPSSTSEAGGKPSEQRAVLLLHDGKYNALVQVVELVEAVMTPAGLKRVPGPASSSLGRTYLDYQLRIVPKPPVVQQSMLAIQVFGHVGDGSPSSRETRIIVNIPKLDIALVDSRPQELILLSVDDLEADYRFGRTVGVDYTQYMVQVKYAQLDDLILGSHHPVVLLPSSAVPSINNLMSFSNQQKIKQDGSQDPLLFMSFVFEPGRRRGMLTCPCIVVSLARLRIAVAETLLWRMYDFYNKLDVGRLSAGGKDTPSTHQQASGNTDLHLDLQLLNVDDVQLQLSFKSDVAARPKFALQGNFSMGLDFANIDDLPLVIPGMLLEDIQLRQSALYGQAVAKLREQALAIVFNLVRASGVGGLASKILAAVSASVAQLGESQPQRSASIREVRDAGEGLVEGGKVFMKGLVKGVTGVIREPISGAERGGITGFTTGVVKGLVGVASAPVSGLLGGVSKVTEGIDATAKKVTGMSQAPQVNRRRLPRAFRGDRILRPFEGRTAMGQALLHLTAPSASLASSSDSNMLMQLMLLGDMKPPDYWQDAYDTHFCLPGELVLIITNHRLLCVHSPGFEKLEEQVLGGRDCDTVPPGQEVWQLRWDQILALELVFQEGGTGPPSVVLIHRRGDRPDDLFVRIQCKVNTTVARDVHQAVVSARKRYFLNPRQQLWMLEDDAISPAKFEQMPDSMECHHFLRVWWGYGIGNKKFSVWRPLAPAGYASLGDVAVPGWERQPPRAARVFKDVIATRAPPGTTPKLALPDGYMLVYRDSGVHTNNRPLTIWSPKAPSGYSELGQVVLSQIEEPSPSLVRCVNKNLLKLAKFQSEPICLLSSGDLPDWKCGMWAVDNPSSTFLSDRMHSQPMPAKALACNFK